MKKNIWMIAGILCGCVFMTCAYLLTSELFDPMSVSLQPGLLVTGLILSALFVNNSCILYDYADGYISGKSVFTRWLKNLVFLGLLAAYVAAVRMVVLGNYEVFLLNTNGAETMMAVLTVVIAFAIIMYLKSSAQNKGRKARIRALRNSSSRYGKRRYTMVVTDSGQSADGKHVTVEGHVHGKIHKGDTVTLAYPDREKETHKVVKIMIGDNVSSSASDNDVKLILDEPYEEKNKVETYTVLSDLHEIHDQKTVNQTENPMLAGIIADYAKYAREPAYQGVLVYALMYSEFLVPGKMVHGSMSGDIMDPLETNSDVGFPTLSSRQNPELKILPVFTDWDALSRWKDMMKERDAVTITADFPMTVELMRKGFSGFVVNPFGPQAFYLSDVFAESVMRMPGYREEMIRRKEEENHD